MATNAKPSGNPDIGLSFEIFLLQNIRTIATSFSPCKRSYVLNQFPSNVMFGMNGFHVSASGAVQGHHGPLVFTKINQYRNFLSSHLLEKSEVLVTN